MNHWGKGRFRAYSAGSQPRGTVHPMTLETLRRHHIPVDGARNKSSTRASRSSRACGSISSVTWR